MPQTVDQISSFLFISGHLFFYPLGTASLLYDFGSGGVGIGRSLVLWTEKPFSAMRTPYDGSVFDCRYRETARHR